MSTILKWIVTDLIVIATCIGLVGMFEPYTGDNKLTQIVEICFMILCYISIIAFPALLVIAVWS